MRKLALSLRLLGAARLVAAQAMAQSSNGIVTGVERDSSGATVPGASVVVTNSGTGLPAGENTEETQHKGFVAPKQKVQVVAGGAVTAEFALSATL